MGIDRRDRTGGTSRALAWSRPNPARLNDTAAIVAKGTYPWTYVKSGTKTPNVLVDPIETAEMTFNGRSRHKFQRNCGVGDESLSMACTQIDKGKC